jgi:hypothetical protein
MAKQIAQKKLSVIPDKMAFACFLASEYYIFTLLWFAVALI